VQIKTEFESVISFLIDIIVLIAFMYYS